MTLPLRTAVVPLALACLPVHGCTPVDDGAVEVSWSIYTDSGTAIDCDRANITEMVLYWNIAGVGNSHLPFPCDDQHGVTDFRVPVGEAELWLQPKCGSVDAVAGSFDAPPPIVRDITEGEVVTLDNQLIRVQTSGPCDAANPCICTP